MNVKLKGKKIGMKKVCKARGEGEWKDVGGRVNQ